MHNRPFLWAIVMHYYQFNIGDFHSHTSHLEPLEDIAFRRMLDYCYLHETGLPESIEEISRLIRMRTHSDCIASVLKEFFFIENSLYKNKRVESDLMAYHEKSEKAAESARKRWEKERNVNNAMAMRPHSDGNANHKPITNNHKPLNNIHKDTSWSDGL